MTGCIKKTVFITTILITLLIGCSSSATQTTISLSMTSTKTALSTVEYTATPIPPTLTPTPTDKPDSTFSPISTEAPIVTNNPRVTAQCLDVSSESEKSSGKGVVVLDTFANLTSANSSVSPNGKLLALEKFESGDIYKNYIYYGF